MKESGFLRLTAFRTVCMGDSCDLSSMRIKIQLLVSVDFHAGWLLMFPVLLATGKIRNALQLSISG